MTRKNGCQNVETERSEKLFGKRNAEMDQEPFSSICSESDSPNLLKKDRKFLSSWLRDSTTVQIVQIRKLPDVLRHLFNYI